MLVQSPSGKLRCVYRSNSGNPTQNWGKTVPSIATDGTRYLVFSNYIADLSAQLNFLEATAHIPYDTPIGAHSFRLSEWQTTPALRSSYQIVKTMSEAKGTVNQGYMRNIRSACIKEYFTRAKLAENTTKPDTELVLQTAQLFCVGERIVRSAIGIRVDDKKKVTVPKSPMLNLRSDPRYAALRRTAAVTRVRANQKGYVCKFRMQDILPRADGVYYLPELCPVLKVPLSYDLPTEARDSYIRSPYAVRIWRKRATHSFDALHMTLMSALAVRFIEGQTVRGDVLDRLKADYPHALEALNSWVTRRRYAE
jgi:hypothetical protein